MPKREDDEQEAAEEEALKLNCEHIAKFVEELGKCDTKALSEEAKQVIIDSQKQVEMLLKIQKSLSEETKEEEIDHKTKKEKEIDQKPPAVIPKVRQTKSKTSSSDTDDDIQTSDPEEVEKHQRKKKITEKKTKRRVSASKSNSNDLSVLEIIAERMDNRRVPLQAKYDEKSGESLESYLNKFEKYCEDNLRGGRSFWVDELESRLTGETLEMFNASKDPDDTYEVLKEKLVEWYNEMKVMRKKRAKAQFEEAKCAPNESLYLYSTRLEKVFRRAFPSNKPEKSSVLREKFIDTIPSEVGKKVREQMFQNRLKEKSTPWSEIQKYARCRDVYKTETKVGKEKVPETEAKEVVINVGEIKEEKVYHKPENKIEVEYDENQKKFYISNPGLLNLRPPQVQFVQKSRNYQSPQYQTRNYQNSNYRQRPNNDNRNNNNGQNQNQGGRFTLPPNGKKMNCYRCGEPGHFIRQCNSNKPKCFSCGNLGHISTECNKKERDNNNKKKPNNEKQEKQENNNQRKSRSRERRSRDLNEEAL